MARIAVIYASSEGQTEKISKHIERVLSAAGHDTHLIDSRDQLGDIDLRGFDGVLVGSSVHAGKHNKHIIAFVKANRSKLDRMPSGFYSVSLAARQRDDSDAGELDRSLDAFFKATGWHPKNMETFAGAILYTQYNPVLRFVIKNFSKAQGDDTDTSRDFEYTDWDGVTRFAKAFLGRLTPEPA